MLTLLIFLVGYSGIFSMQLVDQSYLQEAHPICEKMCENIGYKCIFSCSQDEIDCLDDCADGQSL